MASRVHIQNRQRRRRIDRTRLARLVERVLTAEGMPADRGVTVVLLRDAPMARLNVRYRDREGPTDVLSFPSDPVGWPAEEPRPLGEVVVSIDRACEQAGRRDQALEAELARLVVHGVLHLLGYLDDTRAARARMRRQENRYLRGPGKRR
ncbi:MAG: rRNA maturation RNase YbeY [Candidatus Eisenbacteria sp.]|nr:rRNA maturation RNase YbeY [Candidatus Eisenbacteria bacterium]